METSITISDQDLSRLIFEMFSNADELLTRTVREREEQDARNLRQELYFPQQIGYIFQ
jgi:hypothetical protein